MSGAESGAKLDRRAVVVQLLGRRGETIVVSGLGAPTYDVSACGDHDRNFYLWGAMGGAAMIGLGLALAQPDTPVVVITGDGEQLMGLGAFATIAQQNPANLSIVIIDNERYGETGAQETHTAWRTDLAAVAKACGIGDALTCRTMEDLADLTTRIHAVGRGPTVAVIKVASDTKSKVITTRDGAYLKGRLRQALGLSVD